MTNKLPPELTELLDNINVDTAEMRSFIKHGADHIPTSEAWHTINDALDGNCEVGNVMMLLAMVLDMLRDLGLSAPQQALLIGIYAQQVDQGRELLRKETDPNLN